MVLAVAYTLLSAWIENGESIRRAPTPVATAVKRKNKTRTP
jgi:hypothetical protein